MPDYGVLIKTDESSEWYPHTDLSGRMVRVPLSEAEELAYALYMDDEGVVVVRFGNGEHDFTWRRAEIEAGQRIPLDGQGGRVDAQINERWYYYCDQHDITNLREAEELANRAKEIPEVEALLFGGPAYGQEGGRAFSWSRDGDNI